MNSVRVKAVGRYIVTVERQGKVIDQFEFKNGITNAGLNNMLGVTFHNDTQSATWYAGLISAVAFGSVAAGDTMASHSGWTETSAYSETNRPTWGVGAASGKSITNSTNMTFTINADGTQVAGIFIVNNNTKGGTTGILWCTGLFPSAQTFLNGDLIKVQYTVTLAG
jgi:hypothetical protein